MLTKEQLEQLTNAVVSKLKNNEGEKKDGEREKENNFKSLDDLKSINFAPKTPRTDREKINSAFEKSGLPVGKTVSLQQQRQNDGFDYRRNADEVMHTTNTGKGEELVYDDFAREIINVPEQMDGIDQIIGWFNYRGGDIGASMTFPVLGRLNEFEKGTAEVTDSPLAPSRTITKTPQTGKITITPKMYRTRIGFSEQEIIQNVERGNLIGMVTGRLADIARRTIVKAIINSDSTTAGTGNINSDDSAPAATKYYLAQTTGLRKTALASAALSEDGGALTIADFYEIRKALGVNNSSGQMAFVMNDTTFFKTQQLSQMENQYINGLFSTVNGEASKILGSDIIKLDNDAFTLTEADGKASVTATNNTKGGIIGLNRNCVHWGMGKSLDIKTEDLGPEGYLIDAWFYFGHDFFNLKAGETDPTFFLKYNLTV